MFRQFIIKKENKQKNLVAEKEVDFVTEKKSKVINKEVKVKKVDSTLKKVNAKKVTNTLPKNELKIIKPENYFFLHDGRVLKDLFELAEHLEHISDDVFYHHVNDNKNDFSNWIKDVFENKDLADEICLIREPKQVQLIILKHIAKNKRG